MNVIPIVGIRTARKDALDFPMSIAFSCPKAVWLAATEELECISSYGYKSALQYGKSSYNAFMSTSDLNYPDVII